MIEDAKYHAYICMDEGCTERCICFVSDEGKDYCEEPCGCLVSGADATWKKLDDYLEEIKKLKKSLDTASEAIDEIERFTGEK